MCDNPSSRRPAEILSKRIYRKHGVHRIAPLLGAAGEPFQKRFIKNRCGRTEPARNTAAETGHAVGGIRTHEPVRARLSRPVD